MIITLLVTLPVKSQETVLNEVMASNGTTLADEDGDYEDWIELYNPTGEPVALFGYGLSDDYEQPSRWTFPDTVLQPGAYLLVWASGKDRRTPGETLHTNFSIDADGEEILLTGPDGYLVDELPPTPIPRDISLGRKPDAGPTWFYFTEPTPGAPNITEGISGWLDPPVFSQEGGAFSASFGLALHAEDPNIDIRYTLDGSEPTDSSLRYTGPVPIDNRAGMENDISEIPTNVEYNWRPPAGTVNKATVIRARSFREGFLPSVTVTHTFSVNEQGAHRYSFPVVSLAADREHLFGYETGIYVPGIHSVPDPQFPWRQQGNFTQRGEEWERPVHIEYFTEEGTRVLGQDVGVRIHGGATRSFAQKSLRLYSRAGYGEDRFAYPLFIDKDLQEVKRFILRNSGNDWERTMFRDAYIQRIVRDLDIDSQGYRPVIVFINGEYWGIHNLRERIDKYYLSANHGVDPENVDLLTSDYLVVLEGDREHYETLLHYLREYDIRDPDIYGSVSSKIDIGNLIDYAIAQIFVRNTDWPLNNIDYWRSRTDDGTWRWILYDTDFGFGFTGGPSAYLHNTLRFAVGESDDSPVQPDRTVFPLVKLLRNDDFRKTFILRFSDLLNTTFAPDRLVSILNEMENRYEPEIKEHLDRWYADRSVTVWRNEVGVMRNFAIRRREPVRLHLADYFELGDMYELGVRIGDPAMGHVRVNSLTIGDSLLAYDDSLGVFTWEGRYYEDIPVRVAALPYPGTVFAGWEGFDEDTDTLEIVLDGDTIVRPRFSLYSHTPDSFAMDPKQHNLSSGPYEFTYWSPENPEGIFPQHMVFQQSDVDDPGLSDEMTVPYHIPFVDMNEHEYHENDLDKIGYPYGLTGRSRITGLGENGISFINTGRGRDLGAAVLALSATGRQDVAVSWTAGTLIPNSRTYNIRLQYRVGTEGAFRDVTVNGEPVEYRRNEIAGHTETIGPVILPAEVHDQPYIQVRWKYYHTGVRLDPDTGQRDMLRLGNITVTSNEQEDRLPETVRILQNYPNPFNASTIFRYELPYLSHVTIEIFNSIGQSVEVIKDRMREPGAYDFEWQIPSGRLSSGLYFYRFSVRNQEDSGDWHIESRPMLLVK
jgi:hypothetical protein